MMVQDHEAGGTVEARTLTLGPKECEILGMCQLEGWRTPYGILDPYPAAEINSLVAKGLVQVRWRTMTPEDTAVCAAMRPFEAMRYRCATKLTASGRAIAPPYIEQRKRRDDEVAAQQLEILAAVAQKAALRIVRIGEKPQDPNLISI